MNYIIFDLEATCEDRNINPYWDNETIEIGAVKVNNNKIIDSISIFIKPIENPILTDFCKNLTHISQEDVDNGISFVEALNIFVQWATSNGTEEAIYCSWGYYDKGQIKKDCLRHNIFSEFIDNRHISIKHQYSEVIYNTNNYYGVSKALRRENLSFDGTPHRGIDDAKNIAKIFLKFTNKWLFK